MTVDSTRSGYFGKYRGSVANNIDPQQKGRLQVRVPAVYGTDTLNWALPCVPFAGNGEGLYLIPDIGANIWVEFEAGNIDAPIWSGCFWGEGECPGQMPQVKILKTRAATITLDELNPAAPLRIETPAGDRITITASGVTIESSAGGRIELSGPKVSVNNGALEVL
jgi:uncharacterized protein involved in type VI secretion and phage assembly